jgi:hypothetical protein
MTTKSPIKIPPILYFASTFGFVLKLKSFKTFLSGLANTRIDLLQEFLRELKIKPEDLQKEMFGDIKEIAVSYITQGKMQEMADLKNLLKLTPENIKAILILAIQEQTLNPNFTNIKSFIDKKDFGLNSLVLKEDVQLKEIVKNTMEDLKKMPFSPNGRVLKDESKKLGDLFGIKTEVPAGEKKDPFKFDNKFGGGFDYPKFGTDDLDDDFDFGKGI